MGTKFELTAGQGITLMGFIENLKFPVKVGEGKTLREFSPSFVAGIEHKVGLLRKILKSKEVSPLCEDSGKLLFGDPKAYEAVPAPQEILEQDPDAENSYKVKDKKLKTEFELAGDPTKALFWIVWLWLYAGSDKRLPVGAQQEFAWPIIEQMHRVSIMKDELGITKDGKMGDSELELKTDEDYALSKEAEKPKPAEAKK